MDTAAVILAVSSPPGRAGRGIIRASGEGAFVLIDACIGGSIPGTRGIGPARLVVGGLNLPIMLMRCPGPASFTGEDVVELQMPGQPVLLERIIDSIIEVGSNHAIEVRRSDPATQSFR